MKVNYIEVEGRAGKDAKRVSDKLVVFSVAVDYYRKKLRPAGDNFEDVYDIITVWYDILCFDNNGKNPGANAIKGETYVIKGKLGVKQYKGQTQFEIIADKVEAVIAKTPQQERPKKAAVTRSEMIDEEVPF